VYDLTDWIAAHPGGAQRIISMCGNDSTSDYENQHAGQRSPTATLDRYVIGTLGEPVS
jgi:cytochrome b involved in lipid metabolism